MTSVVDWEAYGSKTKDEADADEGDPAQVRRLLLWADEGGCVVPGEGLPALDIPQGQEAERGGGRGLKGVRTRQGRETAHGTGYWAPSPPFFRQIRGVKGLTENADNGIGSPDERPNLITCCRECNVKKGNRRFKTFEDARAFLLKKSEQNLLG